MVSRLSSFTRVYAFVVAVVGLFGCIPVAQAMQQVPNEGRNVLHDICFRADLGAFNGPTTYAIKSFEDMAQKQDIYGKTPAVAVVLGSVFSTNPALENRVAMLRTLLSMYPDQINIPYTYIASGSAQQYTGTLASYIENLPKMHPAKKAFKLVITDVQRDVLQQQNQALQQQLADAQVTLAHQQGTIAEQQAMLQRLQQEQQQLQGSCSVQQAALQQSEQYKQALEQCCAAAQQAKNQAQTIAAQATVAGSLQQQANQRDRLKIAAMQKKTALCVQEAEERQEWLFQMRRGEASVLREQLAKVQQEKNELQKFITSCIELPNEEARLRRVVGQEEQQERALLPQKLAIDALQACEFAEQQCQSALQRSMLALQKRECVRTKVEIVAKEQSDREALLTQMGQEEVDASIKEWTRKRIDSGCQMAQNNLKQQALDAAQDALQAVKDAHAAVAEHLKAVSPPKKKKKKKKKTAASSAVNDKEVTDLEAEWQKLFEKITGPGFEEDDFIEKLSKDTAAIVATLEKRHPKDNTNFLHYCVSKAHPTATIGGKGKDVCPYTFAILTISSLLMESQDLDPRQRFSILYAGDDFGRTALHHAATLNHNGVLSALLDLGFDANLSDAENNTSLHLAAIHNNVKSCQDLIDIGAEYKQNKAGQTPLHLAAKHGSIAVAHWLVDEQAFDLEAKCNAGKTPLMYALEEMRPGMVASLLLDGAAVSNGINIQPSEDAKTSGRQESFEHVIIQLLGMTNEYRRKDEMPPVLCVLAKYDACAQDIFDFVTAHGMTVEDIEEHKCIIDGSSNIPLSPIQIAAATFSFDTLCFFVKYYRENHTNSLVNVFDYLYQIKCLSDILLGTIFAVSEKNQEDVHGAWFSRAEEFMQWLCDHQHINQPYKAAIAMFCQKLVTEAHSASSSPVSSRLKGKIKEQQKKKKALLDDKLQCLNNIKNIVSVQRQAGSSS